VGSVTRRDSDTVFTDVILVPEERRGLIWRIRGRVALYMLFPWLLSNVSRWTWR
jgi:hypothetical protein